MRTQEHSGQRHQRQKAERARERETCPASSSAVGSWPTMNTTRILPPRREEAPPLLQEAFDSNKVTRTPTVQALKLPSSPVPKKPSTASFQSPVSRQGPAVAVTASHDIGGAAESARSSEAGDCGTSHGLRGLRCLARGRRFILCGAWRVVELHAHNCLLH